MEMTMSHKEGVAADFTNRGAGGGLNHSLAAIAGTLSACLFSPGTLQFLQLGTGFVLGGIQQVQPASAETLKEAASAPAGLLIKAIRGGWNLNMTELAAILGVTRPTLYNWLKDRNPPVSKLVLHHLQTLAAGAEFWSQSASAREGRDFLLDYTGPQANEISVRQAMGRPEVTVDELQDLIHTRHTQYQEARVRTRDIQGDPLPLPAGAAAESSRRLHDLWARNTKALHSARNHTSH